MSNPQGSKSSTPSTNTDNSKSTTSTNQTSSSNTSNGPEPFTRYRVIKDGWGSRRKFQASYGLDMSPEGIEEGNAILEALIKQDAAKK